MLNTPRERGGRDRERDRETERDRQRQTDRQRDRDRETDRQTGGGGVNEFRYATNYYTKITGRQMQAGRALETNKIW